MKTILYADDRDDDIFFLRRACERAGLDEFVNVHAVNDGQKAVDYILGVGEYADRAQHPAPDIVLLDLKMPRRSGLEVLEWIRFSPKFAALQVFMLTSSNQDPDTQRAGALRANGYLIKPGSVSELSRMIDQLADLAGVRC